MKTRLEQQYPWLDDRSAWREVIMRDKTRRDPAGVGHGCWTFGNGRVFAHAS